MSFDSKRTWRLLVSAIIAAAVLAMPAIAQAADSLGWSRTFAGPADIPRPGFDPTPVASGLNSVSFADATHAWAVGVRVDNAAFGLGTRKSMFTYSADGGSTWTSGTISGVDLELRAVDAVSNTDVWAVGDSGTIVHWNGVNWTTQTVSGWSGRFYGVAFADSTHGWAVGEGGGVVYTGNGGTTWSMVTAPGAASALRSVIAISSTSAVAVGDGGTMRALTATTDVSRSSGTADDLFSITFSDAIHAWAVGRNAAVVRSSDGGATWAPVTVTLPAGFTLPYLTMRSVAFANPYDGLIVGTMQMVWRTYDGGANWNPVRLYDPSTLDDYELRGVTFAGSAPDAATPVAVGRPYNEGLNSRDDKSRIYRGSWTGIPVAPPLAPSNAAAADGGAPRPRITVTWTDNSFDENGFVVQRSKDSTAAFSTVATLAASAASWTDTGVDRTSTWYYRVRSFRGALSSAWATTTGFVVGNAIPVAVADSRTTAEDTALVVGAPGVLSNDTDSDGDPLTASPVANVAHGVLVLNANGSFTYTPAADYNGPDSFTYRAYDGIDYSNTVAVSITVTPINEAPVAVADTYVATRDTTLTIAAPGVLANDVELDGDPLTANLVGGVSHGALVLSANGSFTYKPAGGYEGSDSFTYRAYDGTGFSNTVTVSITVSGAPVNYAPVARADARTTAEDTLLAVTALGVLSNDTDANGDPLTASLVGNVSHGALTFNANGSFAYTPAANYNGPDSFTYRAYDGVAYSNTVTVSITVTPVNDAPVALADSRTTSENTALVVSAPGVLSNDTDIDGGPLTASLVGNVSHGELTLNANGSFAYTPAAGYDGPDSFTYHAWDGTAYSNTVTVSITVTPTDSTPPITTSNALAYYANYATIWLYPSDQGGSGVANTYYRLDGGSPIAATNTGAIGVGVHQLEFWSVDVAGNEELPHKAATFTVIGSPSSKGTPTTPGEVATVPHGTAITLSGYMKRYSHTYSVKLYFYRYKSHHWVYSKKVTASAAAIGSFLRYSRTTSVKYAGRWRVRAVRKVGRTTRHSSWRYFNAS